MPPSVFRQASLDRLASPDQLDQLVPVTDRQGWIALTALVIVLATGIGWGVLGTVPQNVSGIGILIRSGGVFEIVPVAGGRVADVSVNVGDIVAEGQVVARIAQPALAERLREAKATLADLRAQHRQLLAHATDDVRLQDTLLAQQRSAVQQTIASARAGLNWYSEKIRIQEQLLREGLLTRQTLLTSQQQRDEAVQKVNDGQAQLAQIDVRELDSANRRLEEARRGELKLDQQARAIAEVERELKRLTEVVAPHTGRILEIMTEQGAIAGDGQPILTLDLMGRSVKDLEAIIYVPSERGKQIHVGMPALIAPSVVKQEEYGFMVARVTYVSEFPATARGMHRVLKNEKLVAELAGSDAPYEVHADLVVDPETPSRYRWSSSNGPALQIQSGTLATAHISIETRRPIELAMPWIRRHSGS